VKKQCPGNNNRFIHKGRKERQESKNTKRKKGRNTERKGSIKGNMMKEGNE
jgi:hypothetical protein